MRSELTKLVTAFWVVGLFCLSYVPVQGQNEVQDRLAPQTAETPKPTIELLHTEIDAVGWVFDALLKYPENDRLWIRFAYLPPWADPSWLGALDVAVNLSASHASSAVRGDRHAGGWLVGYNFRTLVPDYQKRVKVVAIWDTLAARDPFFHVPQTNFEEITVGGKLTKVRKDTFLLAPHLQAALARHVTDTEKSQRIDLIVTQLTGSTGAIYRADFLIEQLLTSARGKYPEFRLINFSPEKFTPFQNLLRERGFFFEQARGLNGAKGAVLLISDVTGKQRVVVAVFGLTSRMPLLVTFDVKDSNDKPYEHFIRNLLAFDTLEDGGEALIPLPNGLWEGILIDDKGNILRVAPPDVVADFTKPNGYTHELEMGMSCVMCHFSKDGYRTIRNDAEFFLGSDADFFGEGEYTYLASGGERITLTKEEAVDKMVSLFGEPIDDPDGILGRARRDFVRAIGYLTDYQVTENGPSSCQLVGEKLKEIYHGYRYQRIGAERICLELGVRVPVGQGRQVLRSLCPPLVEGSLQDPLIALVRNGAEIRRDDLDAIYGEMARRSIDNRATLVAGVTNDK